MQVEARRGVCGCATPGTIAEGGEEDVSDPAIGTVLSAGIVDVFSDKVVNAADLDADAAPAAWAQPDLPRRAIGRFCLAVAAAALVTGAYRAGSRSRGGNLASADRRYCTELRPENGQRGAQCGGDRATHLVAGTRRRLRPAGARG